jgi:REP element-mobilizing transposase RayT
MPLAYFITFTTYGNWLHGTAKGSVDDEHNVYGTPFVEEDASREMQARLDMAQPKYFLNAPARDLVCRAIVAVSAERGWLLWAAHVRTNHAHAVVSAQPDPRRVMSDMKARASRELTSAGFETAGRRRWTRHGSTLHLYRQEQVEAKIRYTLDEQGPRMAWYAREARHQIDPRQKPRQEPRT